MDFSKHPLKIFFSYYKPHWPLFAADMTCAVFMAAIDIAFPMFSRYALNTLIPNHELKTFLILVAVLLVGFCLHKGCNWFVAYWGHVFGTRVEQDMRRDVFDHLEKLPFSFYDTNRTGKIMSRATTDLFEITELAHHGPEDFTIAMLNLIGAFVMMLHIRWELAIIVVIVLPVMIAIGIVSRRNLSKTSKKVKEITAEVNAGLESSISGIRVTKGFNNEEFERKRFAGFNKQFSDAKKWRYKYMATFFSNIEFCNNLLSLVVLGAGGYFIIKGKMTLPDLVAANLFVAAFRAPIGKLNFLVEQYTNGMAGFHRFLEIMRTEPEPADSPDAVEILSARGNINFKNVDFSYTADYPVLSGVNLDIRSGEKFALVGASGGGKSTLCNLIPRFYEITGGEISLDGIDIKKIKKSSLRSQIGIVQQDVFLFAGTIRENIAYGKPTATDAEIEQAARRAEIHDDIMKMPNGYDTIVGERGIKLSGGQKQRVSIARCFLKNPPILILDEATSALDTATEIKIQHSFDELSKGRTTLVIAHRLSTIKNADKIAVVTDHGIAEQGTHDELMAKRGEYYKLRTVQEE
ncbi:ABC transporter ATP-binding protein [Treponema bryantii]|uniref:ABC transporter ATP-binding protein n=1 Tax=Treponema bryantii TaxID=163 RepID=UPI002B30CF97|nr:multidrug ABC transporter ATP-binding protein [Treponema bryantii]